MQTLVLRLFRSRNRPSFQYKSNGVKIMSLLDTGAETPIWCAGEKEFVAAYPSAIKQNWNSEIRGFGKMPENGFVYKIPMFELKSESVTYKIANLMVAVCDHQQIGYDFVMSDTMFSQTNVLYNRIGEKYIEISFEKDVYNCTAKRNAATFSVVTFAQDEIMG